MKSLIVPMAGFSSRFPGTRPKWLLTHPKTNNLMCIESIKGLNLEFFDIIYFTFLEEHNLKYQACLGLDKCLKDCGINIPYKFVILKNNTTSQSETVYQTIKKEKIHGYIFVKDSDGYFETELNNINNKICYTSLENSEVKKVTNKSYLNLDTNNLVLNIVEKKIISTNFSVGGYGFESAEDFCFFFEKLKNFEGECYVSNVIFEMILADKKFTGVETKNFIDWGTLEDWKTFCNEFMTLFVDIDGTLITNSSPYVPPFIGDGKPLEKNIEKINTLYNNGKTKIILTTSRPESYRIDTIQELKNYKIKFDDLIMGLPHSKRILINDYSKTNEYPTAISINLERNSQNLENFL